MKISVFATDLDDSAAAADALLAQIADSDCKPDFMALHLSAPYDVDYMRSRMVDAGAGALHGATSCLGVMSDGGVHFQDGTGAGIFCFQDEGGDFGTAMRPIGDDPAAAAREATLAAMAMSGREGESPDVIWLSTSPGTEELVLEGVQRAVGKSIPILGGSAADNDISGSWAVFDRDSVAQNGVVVSALFTSGEVSYAYQSGYAPTTHTGTITKADGRRLIEIDNRPAVDVYDEWTDGGVIPKDRSQEASILSSSTFTPLGRYLDSVGQVPFFLLAHPATAYPDGSIDLFADVEQGEELTLMKGSVQSLTERAGKVAALASQLRPDPMEDVKGALMVYCGGCMLAVQDQMGDVVSGMQDALPGLPFLGVFTFGEQGMALNGENRHSNLMISCITFS